MMENQLNEIAFRASGLPPQAQQDILRLIKVFEEEDKQRRENPDPQSTSAFDQDEDLPGDGA